MNGTGTGGTGTRRENGKVNAKEIKVIVVTDHQETTQPWQEVPNGTAERWWNELND